MNQKYLSYRSIEPTSGNVLARHGRCSDGILNSRPNYYTHTHANRYNNDNSIIILHANYFNNNILRPYRCGICCIRGALTHTDVIIIIIIKILYMHEKCNIRVVYMRGRSRIITIFTVGNLTYLYP